MSIDDESQRVPALEPTWTELAYELQSAALDQWVAAVSDNPLAPGLLARWTRIHAESFVTSRMQTEELRELRSSDDLGHLLWLQKCIDRDREPSSLDGRKISSLDRQRFRDAVGRAIGLASLENSMAQAAERRARRQVHNLAYGLTHEINNPLANILARAQRLMGSSAAEQDRKSLATIVDQAMRAHEMLAEVMRAVQPPKLSLAPTDLSELVRGVAESLRSDAESASLRWTVDSCSEPAFAEVDPGAFREILRLIGQNAIDVCSPQDSVSWECRVRSEFSHRTTRSAPHGWIEISLRDSGPGLSRVASQSASDLFFSGREHGRGLGISLAVVQRVPEDLGGHFAMHSETGAGCTATVLVPSIPPPPTSRRPVQL